MTLLQHTSGTEATQLVRLDFTSLPLYGREREQQFLLETLQKVCEDGESRWVRVEGPSGCGKTALVDDTFFQISESLGGSEMLLVSSRFYPPTDYPSSPPYSAMTKLFDKLVESFVSRVSAGQANGINKKRWYRSIERALRKEDASLLLSLIPSLKSVMRVQNASVCETKEGKTAVPRGSLAIQGGSMAIQRGSVIGPRGSVVVNTNVNETNTNVVPWSRFHSLFCSLLHVIASPSHPVVLFLDDLQWADDDSLRLFHALVCDKRSRNVMFVTTCQPLDEQQDDNDFLNDLFDDAGFRSVILELEDLDFDELNVMVASALDVLPSSATEKHYHITEPLTSVVYRKTSGNCLDAQQFMALLQDWKLLTYDQHSTRRKLASPFRSSIPKMNINFHQWKWEDSLDEIVRKTSHVASLTVADEPVNKETFQQDVVMARITSLPDVSQFLLTMAAFMGYVFDVALLVDMLLAISSPLLVPSEHDDAALARFKKGHRKLHSFSNGRMNSKKAMAVKMFYELVKHGLIESQRYDDIAEEQPTVTSVTTFQFVHERVHQSAYSVVPEGRERDELHWKIGSFMKQIWSNSATPSVARVRRRMSTQLLLQAREVSFWQMVHHLNIGCRRMANREDRIRLAKLNLRAAQDAQKRSAFLAAAHHADKGLQMILFLKNNSDSIFETQTIDTLSFALCCLLAEMHMQAGNIDECRKSVSDVLRHSSGSLEERMHATLILVRALLMRNDQVHQVGAPLPNNSYYYLDEALEETLSVLKRLGYEFPHSKKHKKWQVFPEIVKTKKAVRHFEQRRNQPRGESEDILPKATDKIQIGALQLISMVALAFLNCPHHPSSSFLLPIFVCRIVQGTIKNGLVSQASTFGFAAYGSLLCMIGDTSEGFRFGALAMRLLKNEETHDAREVEAVVSLVVHNTIGPYKSHYQELLKPLMQAHRVGLKAGSIRHAFANAMCCAMLSYFSGSRIPDMAQKLKLLCQKASMEYSYDPNDVVLLTMESLLQLLLHLMGRAPSDPSTITLTGEVLNQEHVVSVAKQKNNTQVLRVILRMRLELAYHFNCSAPSLEALMLEYEQHHREVPHNSKHHRPIVMPQPHELNPAAQVRELFITGLCYLRLARVKPRFKKQAKKLVGKIGKWAQRGAVSCNHLQRIMLAEQFDIFHRVTNVCPSGSDKKGNAHATNSEPRRGGGLDLFDYAIASAAKGGFLGDEAMANERAGDFCLRHHDPAKAKKYYLRAFGLYQDWGAKAKVHQLIVNYRGLMGTSGPTSTQNGNGDGNHHNHNGRGMTSSSSTSSSNRLQQPQEQVPGQETGGDMIVTASPTPSVVMNKTISNITMDTDAMSASSARGRMFIKTIPPPTLSVSPDPGYL